ncbi:MAG: GxxExxY protein [endosymbiont of Seepiophila jonesi]|uniref:GxxExxY protein n=1 Tax=endosymbiont of Lamellibrachia luymesi TaxID=2200907 RepID=A0A370DUE6_9GAMM|nr:MAG: GxxExxY protein [endosymbiont of Lamellibrachia luymesi]RDH94339.1 MAG: GxxExxY protein [endosymbiont of Seepiophila jonesi]
MDENLLANRVIGAAIEIHKSLGPGMLESVCQRCLARELELRRIEFFREYSVSLSYKGLCIEQAFRADFLVGKGLVLELKVVDVVSQVHKSQLLTYLKWSDCRLGLLLNFGAPSMRMGIHRVVNNL